MCVYPLIYTLRKCLPLTKYKCTCTHSTCMSLPCIYVYSTCRTYYAMGLLLFHRLLESHLICHEVFPIPSILFMMVTKLLPLSGCTVPISYSIIIQQLTLLISHLLMICHPVTVFVSSLILQEVCMFS